MLRKIVLINEDGNQEIDLMTAVKYCGQDEVLKVMDKARTCYVQDILEFDNRIKFEF